MQRLFFSLIVLATALLVMAPQQPLQASDSFMGCSHCKKKKKTDQEENQEKPADPEKTDK